MTNNTSTKSTKVGRRSEKAAVKPGRLDQSTAGIHKLADSNTAAKIRFSATLLRPAATAKADSWTFLTLPKEASSKLPSRGQVTVEGTFNGRPFPATLEPDGQGGHWLKVDRKLREAAGAEPGDVVTLEISPVAEEPEPKVPADLRKALAAATTKAREVWLDITPAARRDYIHWITSGKKAETRVKRIATACDMLAKGKRRPCCFDRSGMYAKSLSCPVADDE
ncbi:MAG: YdeI/OmpD-associated family protein [Planctomycetota bacterium]